MVRPCSFPLGAPFTSRRFSKCCTFTLSCCDPGGVNCVICSGGWGQKKVKFRFLATPGQYQERESEEHWGPGEGSRPPTRNSNCSKSHKQTLSNLPMPQLPSLCCFLLVNLDFKGFGRFWEKNIYRKVEKIHYPSAGFAGRRIVDFKDCSIDIFLEIQNQTYS